MTGRWPTAAFDQVARWERVKFQFPRAAYSVGGDGWFYGALRDEDVPLRSSDLERLINALLADAGVLGLK